MPIQALVLYANFRNITFNLQLNTLSQITNITNQINSINALSAIAETRPPVHLLVRKELENFAKRKGLNANQVAIVKTLNKEIIRELYAIPLWQDIYIKYRVLGTVDVKRRIVFKYKLESLVYQLLTGKTKDEIKAQFQSFLVKEQKYNDDVDEVERIKKAVEASNPSSFANPQDESIRAKVNRQFQRISKATYKLHVHFRLRSNLYLNYLNPNLKKDFSVILNGLDLNIVKPKGRFHTNLGLMLKNFLIIFNLDKMQKSSQRSVFESGLQKSAIGSDRESQRYSTPTVQTE